jgi:hypothetical protein
MSELSERKKIASIPRLVVSTKQGHLLRVEHLDNHKQRKSLQAVVAAIHEIAHEDVIRVFHFATNFEEFHKVIELTMNIAANSNWTANWLYIRFL